MGCDLDVHLWLGWISGFACYALMLKVLGLLHKIMHDKYGREDDDH